MTCTIITLQLEGATWRHSPAGTLLVGVASYLGASLAAKHLDEWSAIIQVTGGNNVFSQTAVYLRVQNTTSFQLLNILATLEAYGKQKIKRV